MRCMRRPGGKIHEEWLVAREQPLLAYPRNCAISHVLHKMVAFLGRLRRIHDLRAFMNCGIPLIGLAGDKAIEVLKTRSCRPAIERPNRTRFPDRDLMALAELRGRIAVESKNLGQRCHRV